MATFTRQPHHPDFTELGSENTPGEHYELCCDDIEFASTYYCGASYVRDGQRWASDGPAGLSLGHRTREDAEQVQIDAYLANSVSSTPRSAPASTSDSAPLPTTWEQALAEAKERGTARCSAPALMASLCAGPLQTMVGAVAPQLVWEGAQKSGMTAKELLHLCSTDPLAVSDLMWL
ncbi:hypothetical protein ABZ829_27825 [Streptomyces xanthochromogenes]|uniref:hypothetical protein n=1 Tax=Streptomyces xanthochromogenes TaxID=67384 RepID=UPI0034319206